MKKNILFISYYFPPIKAIGGIRTYNFVKYLSLNNWSVSVITTSAYKILKNDSFFPKLLHLKYLNIPTLDIQVLIRLFSLIKKNKKIPILNKKPDNKISNTSNMQKIRNSFPFNISYEGGFIYIFFGVIIALYNIKKNNINYLYSTYSPNSNHIIAYFVKCIFPKIIWIADFRDLPSGENETQIFFKKFQIYINNVIYRKANSLIVVSVGIKDKMLKYNSNIRVINNGFDNNINILRQTQKLKTSYFNIVYTGSLYGGKRDSDLLFKVIRKLLDEHQITEKVRLIYAGKDGHIWNYLANKYNLQEYTENYGFLSMKEIKQLQNKASIFLMVTWSTNFESGILTGKFYEYLSYLKPIICLINGNKDKEIEEKFQSLNCGIVIYSMDQNKLAEFLCTNFKEWELKKVISSNYNYKELEKYTSKSLTQKLEVVLLNEIINE